MLICITDAIGLFFLGIPVFRLLAAALTSPILVPTIHEWNVKQKCDVDRNVQENYAVETVSKLVFESFILCVQVAEAEDMVEEKGLSNFIEHL